MTLTLGLLVALKSELGHTDYRVWEKLRDGSAPSGGMELCGEGREEGIVIVCVCLDEELCGRFAVRRLWGCLTLLQSICVCV